MAMRPIFRGFCINWFGIGPKHYISSRFDFGFEFSEFFVIEKRLPDSLPTLRLGESGNLWLSDSANQGVADSPTSFFDYEYLCEFEGKTETARKVV